MLETEKIFLEGDQENKPGNQTANAPGNDDLFLTGRDIILFSLKPWDSQNGPCGRKYAHEFARRNNRVIFVNRALDRMSVLKRKKDPRIQAKLQNLKHKENALKQVEKNIWTLDPPTILESINKIPVAGIYDFLNRVNNKRLADQINKAAAQLGFKDIVLYIENDFLRGQYLPEMIRNCALTIYYIRDFLLSQDYFKTHGKRLEPRLLKRMDIVIANSVYLANYARQYNPNSYFVGQGCDTKLFSGEKGNAPEDMLSIPHPVVGYVGALLSTRLDIELIRQIARGGKWSVVLVGPEDENFKKSDLHQMENVYFLGHKKSDALPGYIAHFDVCINPQAVNEMTTGNYPLKIDEYLAMGRPVVATKTEAMDMFADYVPLAETPDQFVNFIRELVNAGDSDEKKKKRMEFARSHTWENCVSTLDRELKNTLNHRL